MKEESEKFYGIEVDKKDKKSLIEIKDKMEKKKNKVSRSNNH